MLIKTTDGGIVDIMTDGTCLYELPHGGWSSVYLSEITVYMTKYKVEAKVNNEYDYGMTVGDTLKLFLPHIDKIQLMREKEFVVWFMNWVAENAPEASIDFTITDANDLKIKPEDLV